MTTACACRLLLVCACLLAWDYGMDASAALPNVDPCSLRTNPHEEPVVGELSGNPK